MTKYEIRQEGQTGSTTIIIGDKENRWVNFMDGGYSFGDAKKSNETLAFLAGITFAVAALIIASLLF